MGVLDRQGRIARAAGMIAAARRVVVFTGAGVSTESGIPDFRSPGGLWTRFDPEDFTIDRYLASPEARRKHWRFLREGGLGREVQPNAAHRAIAALHALGRLDCVVTQNIDNLHQQAGSPPERVYELHGNMGHVRCLACGRRFALQEVFDPRGDAQASPSCGRCGGLLKPDVVFFGEALPEATLQGAMEAAQGCDLMIVVGSSLVVYPAANLPALAKESGARLIIVNLSPTPLDELVDLVIAAGAGETLDAIVAEVRRRLAPCA